VPTVRNSVSIIHRGCKCDYSAEDINTHAMTGVQGGWFDSTLPAGGYGYGRQYTCDKLFVFDGNPQTTLALGRNIGEYYVRELCCSACADFPSCPGVRDGHVGPAGDGSCKANPPRCSGDDEWFEEVSKLVARWDSPCGQVLMHSFTRAGFRSVCRRPEL